MRNPVVLLVFLLAGVPPSAARERPGFVLLLSDDQGWTGLSVSMDPARDEARSTFYETPHLDRLAREGMRFRRAYSSAPVCAPSRYAIQFGRSPASLHVTCNRVPRDVEIDPRDSLASALKRYDADYLTAHFGKWHIRSHSPEELGFDRSDGSTTNRDGNVPGRLDDPKRSSELGDRAAEFLDECASTGRPFLLQVSWYADHAPSAASRATIARYAAKPSDGHHRDPIFAAMNEELDRAAGVLLERLAELGLDRRTYVIYTSDNGFSEAGKAEPLRGSKWAVHEGGIRVPFIVRGPGIDPGTFSPAPVIGYDLFPTILDAAGAARFVPEGVEGGSLLPVLERGGRGVVRRPDDFFVFHYHPCSRPSTTALLRGRHKLVKSWDPPARELYDLEDDPGETIDLAGRRPGEAEALEREMRAYLQRVGADVPAP